MPRKKLQRFQDIRSFANVVEPSSPNYSSIQSHWSDFFGNNNPLELELACGYGEYTTGLAKIYKNTNYLGVDIKGERFWKGATFALENKINNVGFLRANIANLDRFFAAKEVSGIWIICPDPRPKKSDQRRRLTSPRYLKMYQQITKPDSWIRLKTDNTDLFKYSLDLLTSLDFVDQKSLEYTQDLDNSPLNAEHHGITTKYENLFRNQGERIKYLKFKFAI